MRSFTSICLRLFVPLAVLLFAATSGLAPVASAAGPNAGYVFTESNASNGNAVLAYARSSDGGLTSVGSFPTGGLGTGSGLGSQGALALSDDGRFLLAVNAGSNDVSVLLLANGNVKSRIASGGTMPISVTIHGDTVYVLNAGGTPNISGFWLANSGRLTPISGSTRPLAGTGPAEVKFTSDGEALVVTEKASNTIDTFAVEDGMAQGPFNHPSSGAVPFGFDFGRNDTLIVSEAAASAASSYRVSDEGGLTLITPSLVNGQAAACWVAATHSGQYAFTANAHNGTISSYSVAKDGSLSLLNGVAAAPGGAPLDETVTPGDGYFYVLNPSTGLINGYSIGAGAALSQLAGASGIPTSAAGLVTH